MILTEDELNLLAYARHPRTVKEICAAMHWSGATAGRILRKLVGLELLKKGVGGGHYRKSRCFESTVYEYRLHFDGQKIRVSINGEVIPTPLVGKSTNN